MEFIIFTDLYTNIYLEVSCLRIKYMSKTFETYSHYIYTLSYAADVHSYINIGRVYRQSICLCLYAICDYKNHIRIILLHNIRLYRLIVIQVTILRETQS